MYVVAGVTGNTGAVVASTLLAHGEAVRVIVRQAGQGEVWKARGAEVAVLELSDAGALTTALRGATAAYLLVPPIYGAEDMPAAQRPIVDALAQATRDSDVGHVVLLSSLGAEHAAGTGPIRTLHNTEELLKATGKAVTFLRAAYFFENWAPVLGEAKANGTLMTFLAPQQPVQMIASRDIGRLAADLMVAPSQGVRVVELLGPQPYTPEQVAAELSTLFGRPVTSMSGPLDYVVPTLTGLGFTAGVAALFHEMLGAINDGRVASQGTAMERRFGTLTVSDVARHLTPA